LVVDPSVQQVKIVSGILTTLDLEREKGGEIALLLLKKN